MVCLLPHFLQPISTFTTQVVGIPAAGTALRAARFDLNEEVDFTQLSTAVSKNFTFEAWIMVPYPHNGRYKR